MGPAAAHTDRTRHGEPGELGFESAAQYQYEPIRELQLEVKQLVLVQPKREPTELLAVTSGEPSLGGAAHWGACVVHATSAKVLQRRGHRSSDDSLASTNQTPVNFGPAAVVYPNRARKFQGS